MSDRNIKLFAFRRLSKAVDTGSLSADTNNVLNNILENELHRILRKSLKVCEYNGSKTLLESHVKHALGG